MKKTITKILSIALAAAMCFSLCGFIGTASAATATAYAESTLVPVELTINPGIKINIVTYDADGKAVTSEYKAVDANGAEVMPFIADGTTYLPLRAISYIFGGTATDIQWDSLLHNAMLAIPKTELKVVNPNPGTATIPTGAKTVSAHSGASLYVDDNTTPYVPTDVNGKVVNVYLIDGTTYFPLRAISNLYFGSEEAANAHLSYANSTVTITATAPANQQGDDASLLDSLDVNQIIEEMVAQIKSNIVNFMLNPIEGYKTMRSMLATLATGDEDSDQLIIKSMITLMNPIKVIELFKSVATKLGGMDLDIGALISNAGGISGIMRSVVKGLLTPADIEGTGIIGSMFQGFKNLVSNMSIFSIFKGIDLMF